MVITVSTGCAFDGLLIFSCGDDDFRRLVVVDYVGSGAPANCRRRFRFAVLSLLY